MFHARLCCKCEKVKSVSLMLPTLDILIISVCRVETFFSRSTMTTKNLLWNFIAHKNAAYSSHSFREWASLLSSQIILISFYKLNNNRLTTNKKYGLTLCWCWVAVLTTHLLGPDDLFLFLCAALNCLWQRTINIQLCMSESAEKCQ